MVRLKKQRQKKKKKKNQLVAGDNPCLLSEGSVFTPPEAAEDVQGSVCCGVHAAQIDNI